MKYKLQNMKNFKENIFILVVLVSTFAFGQDKFGNSRESGLTIGIEGGLGIRTLHGNDVIDDQDRALGFEAGLSFQYNINDKLSIKSNLFYSRKGNSFDVVIKNDMNDIGENEAIYSNHDYLTVPILVRYSFGNQIKFFINAGPYFGYFLKHRFETSSGVEINENQNTSDHFKSTDFGVSSGLGVSIPLQESLILSLEIRNNFGLYNTSDLPIMNDGSIKTNSTNALIGLGLKL